MDPGQSKQASEPLKYAGCVSTKGLGKHSCLLPKREHAMSENCMWGLNAKADIENQNCAPFVTAREGQEDQCAHA